SAPMPTIRVSIDRVDRLMNLVGELVITQSMLVQSGTAAGLVTHSPHASGIEELGRLSRDLQDSVMQIRAQPVKPLFQRMARISREVADATGKDIRFDMEGSETEVDTTVIERLSEPLTHMIRNAIDHGIEAAEVRRGTGKPDQGRLTLSAAQRSGRILIKLSDDGGGIDRAAVRARAIDRGIVGADDDLAPEAIDMLLFEPGFSTAQTVTELSGRGVGLDVVREAIRSLGGRISVDSASGTGTTWIISLPLTLAVVDGMVLQVADQTIVMPLAAIRETLAPRAADIMTWDGGMTVMRHHRSVLPLHNLAEILGYAAHRPVTPDQVALIIDDGDAPACAIVVDEIEDQRQVVIKALQDGVPLPPCISAATILGDGRVALIVDPLLVGETQMRRGAAPPPPHSALPGACPGAHVAAAPP
ncbi:MAG: chemotaxis protein CheA, partial [Pseudomonadota bacterium]